jgi:putative redox protein
MAVHIDLEYTGELGCRLTHEPSGSQVDTDAPTDNAGRGLRFSPTDLLAASLLSCATTTMGIKAAREKIPFHVCKGSVDKHMSTGGPRRVARLPVTIHLPADTAPDHRPRLESFARTCPVATSLSESVQITMTFAYDL